MYMQQAAEKTANVIRDYFDAFAQNDIERALALLTEDVVWHVDGDPNVFSIGLLSGKQQVADWMKSFPHQLLPVSLTIKRTLIEAEDAVVIGDFRYLVVTTGHYVGSDMVIHFTLRDGKISRYHIFEDSLLLSRSFNDNEDNTKKEIKLNGTVYAYSDRGNGPVLIFAHGLFADRTIFEAQVATLEKNYRCIVLDLPAHGHSGYRKNGWTLSDLASDLSLFISELKLDPVIFVGQSQGGMIGIILTALFPHLVSGLILIGTSARKEYSDRIERWELVKNRLRSGAWIEKEALFKEIQSQVNTPEWIENHADAAELERKRMHHCDETGLGFAIDAATIHREDIRHHLPKIQARTLILCGENDLATPVELSQEINGLIPDARLVIVEGAAHHPPSEAPDKVLREIQFFASQTFA